MLLLREGPCKYFVGDEDCYFYRVPIFQGYGFVSTRSMYGDRQPIPSFVCKNRNPAAGTDPCQGSTTRQYRVYLSSGPFQSGLAKVLPDLMAGGYRYTRVCLRHTGVSLPWSHLGELASSPDSAFCKVSSLRHSSKLGMQN